VSPLLRATIAVGLFTVSLGTVIAASVCIFLAERSPRSEVARRLVEYERDGSDPRFYSPAPELLDARGQRLRRRGQRLAGAAVVALLALLAFSLVVR
jgi:hypothetical protein